VLFTTRNDVADLVRLPRSGHEMWDQRTDANQSSPIRAPFVPRLFEDLKCALAAVALWDNRARQMRGFVHKPREVI